MDWREIYARRLCTPEQAAALIAPGDRIFAGGAGSFPAVLIDAVSDRAELRGIPVVTVVNGTESRALSDPVCFARTPYHSLFLGTFTGSRRELIKKVFTSPALLAAIAGLLLAVFRIRLPSFLQTTVTTLSGMTSPPTVGDRYGCGVSISVSSP